jgi:hypothetical protein
MHAQIINVKKKSSLSAEITIDVKEWSIQIQNLGYTLLSSITNL